MNRATPSQELREKVKNTTEEVLEDSLKKDCNGRYYCEKRFYYAEEPTVGSNYAKATPRVLFIGESPQSYEKESSPKQPDNDYFEKPWKFHNNRNNIHAKGMYILALNLLSESPQGYDPELPDLEPAIDNKYWDVLKEKDLRSWNKESSNFPQNDGGPNVMSYIAFLNAQRFHTGEKAKSIENLDHKLLRKHITDLEPRLVVLQGKKATEAFKEIKDTFSTKVRANIEKAWSTWHPTYLLFQSDCTAQNLWDNREEIPFTNA